MIFPGDLPDTDKRRCAIPKKRGRVIFSIRLVLRAEVKRFSAKRRIVYAELFQTLRVRVFPIVDISVFVCYNDKEKEKCMQYKVYCLLNDEKYAVKNGKVVRVKVVADCIADALKKAKEMFMKKLEESKFKIFMYETAAE